MLWLGAAAGPLLEIRGVTAKYWAPGGKGAGSNNGNGNKSGLTMEAQME